ncbi:DNA polymerase III subunit delta [Bacillus glycinifermentans]|uniref:DNA polymerase III subunit delta n=1 Tax=Bacillus glycinifermentans TaxID=1664069 RepID=A0A0T6BUV8_9BACI|nr:DNA polymerase III subunit delta [Bacillus glycinifermentans]ATH95452.1 DNA polymerase III subunit delta [Bacillus glycinifermentans]KRT95428.1 DNA polymerase III subunit delta [Bacillus glycinifermentans]MEC0485006.1 DNA polymerase III subunit delta [Bacillus glycinifermentans]MEC0496116.1 DNA polymerase III subunit delta [Bacillus glycinifermentans]MEC0539235.1 DNA polymerase III subunit delta [Bacillus glycinifermentans]
MVFDVWKSLKKGDIHPVYCLYGKETYLLQETVQRIRQAVVDEETKDFNLSVFDLEEDALDLAVEDAETFPFMGERRLVVAKNPTFLTAEKKKDKPEHNLEALEAYIAQPAPYSVFVLLAPYEKLDERKKLTKLLKKHADMVEAKELNGPETADFIKGLAKSEGKQIDSDAAEELVILCNASLSAIAQEVKKLSTYIGDRDEILLEDVRKLVARGLEQNIFELINKVVNRRRTEALQIFYDLLKQNEEPIKMMALIANQFRLILQTKYFSQQGYGQKQIASNLKVHPFRIKLAIDQARLFSETELKSIMEQLAVMDYEMKTGKKDKQLLLELFLLKLLQPSEKSGSL